MRADGALLWGIQALMWGCKRQLTLLLCSEIRLLEAVGEMLWGRKGLPRDRPTLLPGAEGQRGSSGRALITMRTGLKL